MICLKLSAETMCCMANDNSACHPFQCAS